MWFSLTSSPGSVVFLTCFAGNPCLENPTMSLRHWWFCTFITRIIIIVIIISSSSSSLTPSPPVSLYCQTLVLQLWLIYSVNCVSFISAVLLYISCSPEAVCVALLCSDNYHWLPPKQFYWVGLPGQLLCQSGQAWSTSSWPAVDVSHTAAWYRFAVESTERSEVRISRSWSWFLLAVWLIINWIFFSLKCRKQCIQICCLLHA